MRILRNERRIRTLSWIGQYASLAGMMILFAGLTISLVRPSWILPLLIALPVGFILSVAGSFFADRYAGTLAHHVALPRVLKGLSDRYILLEYLLPASHVLLGPGGFTVFVVKPQGGEVTYDEEHDRWRHQQRRKILKQLAGQEAVGAPHVEAGHQAAKLRDWLARELPDIEDQVPIQPAIVFVNPDAMIHADGSPVPAFYCKKVKTWLRGPGEQKRLPASVRRQLAEAIDLDGQEESEEDS